MTTTTTTASRDGVAFALRTDDAAWIARNHGVTDEDGRTFVQVAADEVELVKRGGADWIRCTFADIPADARTAAASCPASWVPETAERLAGPYALDGRELFLAKMRGER